MSSGWIALLVTLHILGCLLFGIAGSVTYYLLGKAADGTIASATATNEERARTMALAVQGRKQILPWIIMSWFVWEVNLLISLGRKVFSG